MKGIKRGIVCLLVFLNFYSLAQVGFGIRGGFQQSVPLVMRDSFSGKPALSGGINFYIPAGTKLNFLAGIGYREVAISHKVESSNLNWETLGLNLGAEWINPKFSNTSFYTGINANYIYTFSKTVLSGNTSSGSGYATLKTKQKFVPSIEAGITFKPKKFINITVSTIQPIPQTINYGKPTLPGTLSFGIEYRLTTRDIKNWKKDTTPYPQNTFTNNLKNGTLYFIEDGTDSSHRVFRKMIKENYHFSNVNFIKGNSLRQMLDSLSQSPDSNRIFIVKTGSIVYSMERATTQGLIVYNYKMQDPIPDSPFFIRNLTGDSLFEDPLVVKRMVKTLNKRLIKMYNEYRK